MKTVTIYIPAEEFSQMIQCKIPDDDQALVGDCIWTPMKIDICRDMSINITAVAARRGNLENRRFRINREALCER